VSEQAKLELEALLSLAALKFRGGLAARITIRRRFLRLTPVRWGDAGA